MNYDYFEQNIFLPQIKPFLFNRLKPHEEITMENVYVLGMTSLKHDIEIAKLRLLEFGTQERVIKLYSILSYIMYKEDRGNKGATAYVDILARPLLLNNIIDKECRHRIDNIKSNKGDKTEFILLLERFDFKDIELEHLFALLFWFRLERTLKYHDKNKYLFVNDKQEKVYFFGNNSLDNHSNIMNMNLFFMSDFSECLKLKSLHIIATYRMSIANWNKHPNSIQNIKNTYDEFSKIIEKEKVKAQNELRNEYFKERQKGGKNSHQAYKPLKAKVEELCKMELSKRKSLSARQLSHIVAKEIESKHKNLLKDFSPYKAQDGTDWRDGSFYNWCNEVYKTSKK